MDSCIDERRRMMICMDCGGELVKSDKPIDYKIRGEVFTFDSILHFICEDCGEISIDLESADELSNQANEMYRDRHGLMRPEEIRRIRNSYSVTQQDFEKVIGSGKTTISRWESGAVMQPAVADTLLRVLRDCPDVWESLAERAGINTSNDYSQIGSQP